MKRSHSLMPAALLVCLSTMTSFADQTVTLTALAPGQTFIGLSSGNAYKADNQGNINNVHASDVPALLKAGATIQTTSGSGSSPGGTNGQYQYNNNGVLAGTSTLPSTVITGLGSAAAQPTTAFDAAGLAASVGTAIKNLKGATQSTFLGGRIPSEWSRPMSTNGYFNATDIGGTSRCLFVEPVAVTDPQVVFQNYVSGQSPEGTAGTQSAMTITATFEYPAGTFTPISVNGKTTFIDQPGADLKSDILGIDLPAGAQYWVRPYIQVSLPPTTPAVAAGTGGSLAAATYYYKVTNLSGEQGESGPSTEVSAAVSASGTAQVSWGFNSASTPSTGMRVYRSTATGTEVLLATLPPWTTSWTDTGALTPGTATPPTTFQKANLGAFLFGNGSPSVRPGEGMNYVSSGGTGNNGSNQINTVGTSWESSVNGAGYCPTTVLATPTSGLDYAAPIIIGDSIADGYMDAGDRGYIVYGLINNSPAFGYFDVPLSGETVATALTPAYNTRIKMAEGATDAITEYGINDIRGSATLATLQANEIALYIRLKSRGVLRIWQTTITPNTSSTDGWATVTNQSFNAAQNTVRTGFNDWLRASAPMLITGSAVAPVYSATTTGTTGAVLAGTCNAIACNLLAGYFDPASLIEVNSSNVLTLDGGYWITNGSGGYATQDGLHPVRVNLLSPAIITSRFTAP